MTSRDFAYWMQGFFEISNAKTITEEQTTMIKKHLALVFYHEIDPSYTNDENKQQTMNYMHINGPSGLQPSENDVVYRC